MQYSKDQIEAIDGIEEWLNNDNGTARVLTGAAGCGKTVLMKEVLHIAANANLNVELAAMTHKAADIVITATGVSCKTVHHLFGLSPAIDSNGKETLNQTGSIQIKSGALVIIDESSMIGERLLQKIAKTIKELNSKVLFVGDPYQLPPIGERCNVFDGSIPTYTLTTVHRQQGINPILDKATEFREFIEGTRPEMPTITSDLNADGEGIHLMSQQDFTSQFITQYIDYTPDMEIETPLCTYTNVGAHKYNQMIRNSMFFLNANIEPYYPDERLISNGSITLNKQLLVKNNAVVRVKHYKSSSLTSSLGNTITGYDVTLQQTSKNKPIILFTPITPEAGKTYISNIAKGARKLQNIKNRGKITPEQDIQRRDLWKEMFNAQGSMGDLRPPYAQTTHKAQGATHDSVYIDLQDIMKCRQHTLRARLLYVALTRAKTNCYIREDIK